MLNKLKPGDEVALIAPARAVSQQEMQNFISLLENWNLHVQLGNYLFEKENQFSATDEKRATDFLAAWNNENIKAIFCARGGYGCVRMLPYLENYNFNNNPKTLVGYSDITMLQLFLAKNNIPSIHGPMAINMNKPWEEVGENFTYLQHALFNQHIKYKIDHLPIINNNPFEGKLIGGNLSLIYAAMGTKEEPDLTNAVLFIEDLDEYLYHIDRMVQALLRSGKLNQLKAVIIGEMLDMKDNAIPFGKNANEIILDLLSPLNIPMIHNFPLGHGQKNYCVIQNYHCKFDGEYFIQ